MDHSNPLWNYLRRNRVFGPPLRALYGLWLNCTAAKHGVLWSYNGEPVRIHPCVRHLVPPISEPELFEYLRRNIRPGETVLDVGSFLGIYAIFAARWVGPNGKVVAFEPTPQCRSLIHVHLRYNDMQSRVHVIEAAAGKEEGVVQFTLLKEEPYRNMVVSQSIRSHKGSLITVPVTTLDKVCKELNLQPDWIRMDVQGYEFEVLKGARKILAAGKGRLRILAEMHPQLWSSLGITLDGVQEILADLGLACEALLPGSSPFLPDAHAILRPL
jgi:FkbM family methyltransferase